MKHRRPLSVGVHALAILRERDHDKWVETIRGALRRGSSVVAGAKVLGVHWTSLYRWMREEPDLRAGIDLPSVGHPLGVGANSGAPAPRE